MSQVINLDVSCRIDKHHRGGTKLQLLCSDESMMPITTKYNANSPDQMSSSGHRIHRELTSRPHISRHSWLEAHPLLLTSLSTASDFPFRLDDSDSAMVAPTLPVGSPNLARQGCSGSSNIPRPPPQRFAGAWLRHSSSVGDQRNHEVAAASQSSRSNDPDISVRQESPSSASSLQFPSRREAEPAPQEEPPLVRVRLSVHYRVHSRQMLCIGGSQIPFGWSFLSIAKVPMTWTEGDLWTTEVRCGTLLPL